MVFAEPVVHGAFWQERLEAVSNTPQPSILKVIPSAVISQAVRLHHRFLFPCCHLRSKSSLSLPFIRSLRSARLTALSQRVGVAKAKLLDNLVVKCFSFCVVV